MVNKSPEQTGLSVNKKRLIYIAVAATLILIPAAYIFSISITQTSPSTAAIIDQLGSSKLAANIRFENLTFVEFSEKLLHSRFSVVDYYSDNATIEQYKELASKSYKLIIWRAHSALDLSSKYVAISATDKYNSNYDQYLDNDQLTLCNITGDSDLSKIYLGITPKFVTEVMNGRFGGTAIILMSCNGLRNGYHKTAQAFEEKGAAVFISWDDWVDFENNDCASGLLLQYLITDNETVSAAISRIPPYPSESGATVHLLYDPEDAANYRIPSYVQNGESTTSQSTQLIIMEKLRKTGTLPSKTNSACWTH